ncbi:MAG TPA: polymer-forming cytoskeletal protein [Candidatus Saccharimonadia bacterium]|jgi:cytoskeletal protein CcmA (bactofilin family)
MARRTHEDALGVAGAETIIGTGVIVHGNLESESDIIIDGTLDGQIKTAGNVTLGINAIVKADIQGSNVTIAGSLKGNINAEGEAVIRETGHVEGDIRCLGLSIATGGVFSGRSFMEAPPRLDPDIAVDGVEPPEPAGPAPRKPSRGNKE